MNMGDNDVTDYTYFDLEDPFIDSEPTEEEYNRERDKLKDLVQSHPKCKFFSRMKRRVFCHSCHNQMEIAEDICICHNCNTQIKNEVEYIDRKGNRHKLYEN